MYNIEGSSVYIFFLKSKSKIYNCTAVADYVKGIAKATQHKIKTVCTVSLFFHSFLNMCVFLWPAARKEFHEIT